ncbi:hypothetical protein UFOVP129_87 [uncultured Caudovirales phage]|uniref:Uncharacterized protein n=1 Tax=uncultured Caudovirales phage TaxID=2100421 RepID=A0A6J5LA17_9CAUD|nr:hypothetical protein UFOVP129_87 [uncultured Caudovirales phage]
MNNIVVFGQAMTNEYYDKQTYLSQPIKLEK